MDETFKGIEANDLATRAAAFEHHHAAPQVEDDEDRQYSEDGDTADPAQSHAVKVLPVAADRVLNHVGLHIRNRAATLDCLELLEQLLLRYRARLRIDRAWLLSGRGSRHCDHECERQRAGDQSRMSSKFRHALGSLHMRALLNQPAVWQVPHDRHAYVAIDSL